MSGVEQGARLEYSANGGTSWTSLFVPQEGSNTVAVRQVDTAGNASAASTALSFTLDRTAPAAPSSQLGAGLADGATLSEATSATGALSIAMGEASASNPIGLSVTFSRAGAAEIVKTSTLTSATAAPIVLTRDEVEALGDGLITVSVRGIDQAGNQSTASSLQFALSTGRLSPSISLNKSTLKSFVDGAGNDVVETDTVTITFPQPVTGFDISDLSASQATLSNLTGPTILQSGGVQYSALLTPILGVESASNTVSIGTDYSYSNQSPGIASKSSNYQIDTKGPSATITAVFDSVVPKLGNVVLTTGSTVPGGITNDNTPSFTVSTDASVAAVKVYARLGTTLSELTGTTTKTKSAGNLNWTITPTALPDGTYQFEARGFDVLGNRGAASTAVPLTIVTQPPGGLTAVLTNDTGASSSDRVTSNPALTISGKQEGTLTEYSLNGGTSWTSVYNPPDGIVSLLLRQRDTADNVSTNSQTLVFQLDRAAATSISSSSTTIAENLQANSVVGNLSATPASTSTINQGYSFALVTGSGSTDNSAFTISGSELRLANAADFETKSSYAIRVRATDLAGNAYEQALTVSVTNANDAPVLNTSASPSLASIQRNLPSSSNAGTTVAAMVVDGSITDQDVSTAPESIYLPSSANVNANQNGTWQFKLGGQNVWNDISFSSTANAGKALLLSASDSIRFLPKVNFAGSANLSFGAWDQTTGSAGSWVSITTGPESAFSSSTDTASIAVTAPSSDNDPPKIAISSTQPQPLKAGQTATINFTLSEASNDFG
ncbi:MAG: cadherin repeat domain-containing protein, partial [Betaproteobacteria bacterium]|nr:cadherin repeat domain-containing protein [Betaproteobacteria bacterium]